MKEGERVAGGREKERKDRRIRTQKHSLRTFFTRKKK